MVRFALRRRSVWAVRRNGLSAVLTAAAADDRKAAVNRAGSARVGCLSARLAHGRAAGRDGSETRQTIPDDGTGPIVRGPALRQVAVQEVVTNAKER